MLPALHRSLQRLIYEYGQIDQREVEISFEAPTRERVERLTRPTLSLFLYDIQENLELRQSSMETTRGNGRAMHRLASRRFDLHYMVSALTTNLDDEHLLLWRALVTLVRHPQIPENVLEQELQTLDPLPLGRVYRENDIQKQFSAWNALGMPPHPAFCYVISVPIELDPFGEAPLVLRRTARYSGIQTTHNIWETRHQLGGVVRDKQGAPLAGISVALVGSTQECLTDQTGQFLLRDVPTGSIQLQVGRSGAVQQTFVIAVPENLPDGKATSQLYYNVIVESDVASEVVSTD
jgi:hypothetical protein